MGAHHLPHVALRDVHGRGDLFHDFTLLHMTVLQSESSPRSLKWGLLFLFMIVLAMDMQGQCVMCKAVAEDSAEEGTLGEGLNTGILYLMAIPYALLSVFGWILYRNHVASKKSVEQGDSKS